jgi:predicted AAA+ superfamily ATPase
VADLMTLDEFWELIERTHQASGGDPEKQCELLVQALAEMPIEDILDYGRFQDQFEDEAYRTDVWNAAFLIDSSGDDGFMDFRAWLVAQGKAIFEKILADPDSLADYVSVERSEETTWEGLLYVASYAYQRKLDTEEYPPIQGKYPQLKEVENHPLTEGEEELKVLYPKMWAKFGW